MNKKELVAKVAESTGLSKKKAGEVVDAIFSTRDNGGIIAGELAGGNKVTIPGFGTFSVRTREARTATSPGSGAKIRVPSRTYARFKPGKNLRGLVDG